MKTLIIIPAYNEQDSILKVIEDVEKNAAGCDYLVINDGSTDNTQKVLENNRINHLNLPVNTGIGGAVQTGYKYACESGYDIVVQFDGDGQHKAEYILQMVDIISRKQADMVIGSRFMGTEGYKSTLLRRLGIKYFKFLIRMLSGSEISDSTSGFRACNSDIIQLFAKNYPQDYPEPESIMSIKRKNFRIEEIPVVMQKRNGGKSSISRALSVYYVAKVTIAILISRTRPKVT